MNSYLLYSKTFAESNARRCFLILNIICAGANLPDGYKIDFFGHHDFSRILGRFVILWSTTELLSTIGIFIVDLGAGSRFLGVIDRY